MLAPLAYNPNGATSAERYPNLFRYISIVESLEKFFFWILVAIGFIYFAVVNVSAIGHFLDGDRLLPVDVFFVSAISLFLYLLIVWLTYIAAVAGTEFLRLVIDVENNTHK
jgi:hypothetical protein